MDISIKIGDEFLDVGKTDFSIIRAVNDIANIENRQGSMSNDFDITLTATNQRILGYANLSNIVYTDKRPSKKIPAEIYQRNTRIASGYIQIVNTNYREGKITITFYGDNIDIFDSLKSINLKDLDLSRYNHIYRGNIVAASSALIGRTEGYVYAPVNYGNKDSSSVIEFKMQRQSPLNPLEEDAGDGREILPSTFLHTIFSQMAYQIGYTVGGNFKYNPIYNKLVLPFSNQFFINKASERSYFKCQYDTDKSYSFPGVHDFQFDSKEDPSGSFNLSNSEYTSPEALRGKVVFHMKIPQAAVIGVYVNGVLQVSITKSPNIYDFETPTYIVLNTGDKLSFKVSGAGSGIDVLAGSYITFSIDNKISEGSLVELSETLPELTCADILKDILIRYGLILNTDYERKIININQFSTIKNNIHLAKDWSSKLDISEDIYSEYNTLIDNYAKVNKFKNKEDSSDSLLKDYLNKYDTGFGDGSFSIDNDFIEAEKDLYESCFAPTICSYAFKFSILGEPISYAYLPRIQRYDSDGNLTQKPIPRIAIYYGDIDYSEIASDPFVISSSDGDYTYNTVPFIYFYKEDIGTTLKEFKENLCFGDPFVDQPNGINLIDRNYSDYIKVFNEGYLFYASIRINEIDMNQLDYSIPIYLQRYKSYYALNKIDGYQGDGSSTPCELIKL